ncbi:MAG: PAS domain S-box protein [Chitinophagaceae bacterium]|nr:PAS domain S-box protein [Chitinophagaceae bacterium]
MKAKKEIPKTVTKQVAYEPLVKSTNLFPVVGIGASAGGLDAFKKLLKAIPEDSGMAYVLVQHLDPSHESMLPELLQKVTNIPVLEIADDIKVEPNHIYVIPSNKMMMATDGVLLLAPRPAKSKTERNLPIDLFFASLAEVHQDHAIGVVLSGTASDGTLGLKAIKDHGGITFAQDEASAAYEGMPHSAAEAGVVDFILPPEKIPQKLLEVVHIITGNGHSEEELPQQDADVFKQILSLLRIRKGTDFTYYKQTTIRRRILRRMAINKNEEPVTYLTFLRENKTEQDVLYQDLLIPVTAFFRDLKTFDNLCESVFPLIVKNKLPGEPIRIWVAGCSTGEEAYSIAICLKEYLDKTSAYTTGSLQIFATDISEPAIAKARTGIYTKSNTTGLTAQQLQEFFIKINGSYQASKSIRDMCVFAVHNFLKDPPFGKMDFISCRNVLIYMEPYLQKKALTTFHYSLNPKGFLLLGKSETTSGVPELYASVSKADKLYSRKDVQGRFFQTPTLRSEQSFSDMNTNTKTVNPKTDFQKTADDIMLSRYTPPGVVVNEAMDIVHFRGNTASYLQQSPGKPSHNLLKMAKEGLAFELRNILHKTKKEKQPVIKENIPVKINGVLQNVSIEAFLLPETIEPHYLVLFHENLRHEPSDMNGEIPAKKGSRLTTHDSRLTKHIQQLASELAQSREDMRSITEDQEAANEELQSANEELLSSSEELQSLNEELETGKEELQSTNEELMVINQEMISLNEQVTAAKDYAEAIIANIHEPLLVLDKTLRIKTANNAFYKTFQVNEKETESLLIYDLGNKQWNIPELRMLLEKILPEKSVFNDFEVTHTFSTIGERIMLLNAREVINKNSSEKLILLSIEDITARKKAQNILDKTGEHFRQLVKELPAAVYSCDAQGHINFYNDAAVKIWGREPELGKEQWCGSLKMFKPDGSPLPHDSCPMAIAIKEGRIVPGEEVIIERPDGSRSVVRVYPQPEFGLSGEITGAINMGFDVTEQVNARNKMEESEKKFRLIAELMPQKIWTSDAVGNKDYFNKTLLEYVGLSAEELKSNGWKMMIHPDDWKRNESVWQQSVATGKDYEAENRLLRKDGVYQWHLTRAVALKDHDGNIKRWIGSKTEMQEQKEEKEELEKLVAERTSELEDANKELGQKHHELIITKEKLLSEYSRSLIEASLDPLVTINPEGKVTDMNQATVNITGLSREQLTGTNFFNYFTEPEKAQGVYKEVFAKGSVVNAPLTLRHIDGKLTDVLLNGSVYKDDKVNVLGVVLVARDVTEEKRIATELTEAIVFAELATGIAEEAKQKAEEATGIAEDAVKSKQQFLSNMSHEIRTPMNAIIGFTKVVLKTELNAKQREYLTAIKLSGNSLIVLINDILDLAKVDAGKMTFEEIPFKMASSIEAMIHLFETKVQEKNLELVKVYDAAIPEVLLGDPVRLHQIILNLVSNAVKFTTKGKITVSLHLLATDEENVSIEFAVADTGTGIAAGKTEKIFENFHQVSSDTSRLYGGTGLGLAIVKQLVESQGGQISVQSKVNEGSVFSFTLSFKKTDAKAETENEMPEPDAENKNIKVLVVEDIALNQLLMKTLLDDFGFERDIAANGKIAIEKLQEKNYDIILMDLQMPEMNGFEATEYIRNKMHSIIPIIALTADVTTVDLEKCKAVGMNDYIAKPVDERILYSKIAGLVKKPVQEKTALSDFDITTVSKKIKYTDLTYLTGITKFDTKLMMEMIEMYLAQTPVLMNAITKSLQQNDWDGLHAAAHKMLPSFSIMGIGKDFELMAKTIQEYKGSKNELKNIQELALQLQHVCNEACAELNEEYNTLKNTRL